VNPLLLNRDGDPAFAPELHDAVLEAMTGLRSGNPVAVDMARRELAERRARRADPAPHEVLEDDLGLDAIWGAMAAGDGFLYEVARRCVLSALDDPAAVTYRQRALQDAIAHPRVLRDLYSATLEGLENERTGGPLWRTAGAGSVLHRSVQVLTLQLPVFRRLRDLAERHAPAFRSEAFRRFFAMIEAELDDEYLTTAAARLEELRFRHGLSETGHLGRGLGTARYTVRSRRTPAVLERLRLRRGPGASFSVPPRDEAGLRALEALRARGLAEVAAAVGESADRVRDFFATLRIELAFYLGAINLHERLAADRSPTCFPTLSRTGRPALRVRGLYDVALSLHTGGGLVGNDADASGRPLIVITGANQGGKSTLLRAIGIAQLMAQSGLFVGADELAVEACAGVHTHFRREEDPRLRGGKLDEELRRMAGIAARIRPGALLLLNESFASTNEREGSEIGRGVIRAMLDRGVRVGLVTHLYDLAHGLAGRPGDRALFLRAERRPDGRRTFRLVPGEPRPTSYAADSYRRIFGEDPAATAAEPVSGTAEERAG
jgi:hypothetical protein